MPPFQLPVFLLQLFKLSVGSFEFNLYFRPGPLFFDQLIFYATQSKLCLLKIVGYLMTDVFGTLCFPVLMPL